MWLFYKWLPYWMSFSETRKTWFTSKEVAWHTPYTAWLRSVIFIRKSIKLRISANVFKIVFGSFSALIFQLKRVLKQDRCNRWLSFSKRVFFFLGWSLAAMNFTTLPGTSACFVSCIMYMRSSAFKRFLGRSHIMQDPCFLLWLPPWILTFLLGFGSEYSCKHVCRSWAEPTGM